MITGLITCIASFVSYTSLAAINLSNCTMNTTGYYYTSTGMPLKIYVRKPKRVAPLPKKKVDPTVYGPRSIINYGYTPY